MKFNEYKHWRKPKKKNKDIIPKVIDNLDRIKDSLLASTDNTAYNNAFALDTVIKWLSTLTNVNESLRKNTLIKCVKKLDEIYNSLNEAGYNWNKGMSNNAVSAYENGEKPLSKWTKKDIIQNIMLLLDEEDNNFDKNEILNLLNKSNIKMLKNNFLRESSWHHTSKFYNKTYFYMTPVDIPEFEECWESFLDDFNNIGKDKIEKQIIDFILNNFTLTKYGSRVDTFIKLPNSIEYVGKYKNNNIDTVRLMQWYDEKTPSLQFLDNNYVINGENIDEEFLTNIFNQLKLKIDDNITEDYKSDMYYAKQRYVQNLMRRNAEIETLTEEQHEVLEELASFRHEFHTSFKDMFVGNSNLYKEINNGDYSPINDRLEEVDLPIIKWSVDITDIPDYDWVDFDCQKSDYETYEEYETAYQELYDEYYNQAFDSYGMLNKDIENYLAEIDKIHGTQYCPTGIARMRRYEDFRLMDKEEPEYQLGDAYIVDTKQELIDGLNKIIIGDTIALKQDDREITIYFNDENDYSILDDDGTIDDSLRYDDIGRIHDMTKEDVLDWIEVYI